MSYDYDDYCAACEDVRHCARGHRLVPQCLNDDDETVFGCECDKPLPLRPVVNNIAELIDDDLPF